jgi:MoxR-like ATPase
MNAHTFASLPHYRPTGRECELFELAHANRLPLLLKGPTGCGKTRFVEHMAARMGQPLHTVACHDDLSAADLIGRYLLKGGETVWVDGPLTRAVRDRGDLLPGRGGGGPQGRDRGPAPPDRQPPHPDDRPDGRGACTRPTASC